jgi:trans-aconitate methyltransferase
VLELGCGRGVGGEIILDRLGGAQLELIDIDPDLVERARRTNRAFSHVLRSGEESSR